MFYKHQVGHLIWTFYIFKILGKLCTLDVIMTANFLNVNPVNMMEVCSIYVQKMWKGGKVEIIEDITIGRLDRFFKI